MILIILSILTTKKLLLIIIKIKHKIILILEKRKNLNIKLFLAQKLMDCYYIILLFLIQILLCKDELKE
jgi:hypothetical protein